MAPVGYIQIGSNFTRTGGEGNGPTTNSSDPALVSGGRVEVFVQLVSATNAIAVTINPSVYIDGVGWTGGQRQTIPVGGIAYCGGIGGSGFTYPSGGGITNRRLSLYGAGEKPPMVERRLYPNGPIVAVPMEIPPPQEGRAVEAGNQTAVYAGVASGFGGTITLALLARDYGGRAE